MSPAFATVNPATGRRVRSYRTHSAAAVEAAVRRAHAAATKWRDTPVAVRGRLLRAAASILRARADAYAALITQEMGKPRAEAKAEVLKCAGACEFYARHGRAFLAPEQPPGTAENVRVVFEPLGVVLAIMPWNFPFWQVFRAAVPALLAGNTVLLKHSPNVSGCALAIARCLGSAASASAPAKARVQRATAGSTQHLLQTLLIPTDKIPALIADPRIQGVTFTGSTGAGRAVAALAGAAMKHGVFELGGSDAYVILGDADLDQAAEICAQSRLLNAGQSCISAKRFIVVAPVRRPFEEKFAARLAARRVGDPRDPATAIGPMARRDLRDHLHAQVQASLAAGARLRLGGRPLPGPGFFYPAHPAHRRQARPARPR